VTTKPIIVSDHAVLRYLERAHGLDVKALRRHLADRCVTGARLKAIGVTIENVKFLLRDKADAVVVVTALEPQWPAILESDEGGR
jgi:hypothetical protein